jgi:anthranilate phosphoribosyltransferase
MPLSDFTKSLETGKPLAEADVAAAAAGLLDDAVPNEVKAGFLRVLARKGETAGEVAGFVRAFLRLAVRPPIDFAGLGRPAIDVCGTGGDRLGFFNVSTTAMFILAACGAAVVKHGNRGVTSLSGSADVLESLGLRIDLAPAEFPECVRRVGVGFMLAPVYHPAFKAVAPVRQILAAENTRTIFNIIGPLLNPCQPPFQLAGVFDRSLVRTFAEIFRQLGRRCAWAVHGETADGRGIDEMSTLGPTHVARVEAGRIDEDVLPRPGRFPPPESIHQLAGGDAATNAEILESILRGETRGPKRDLAVYNAAAGLVITGIAPDLESACDMAEEAIDSFKAARVLDAWRAFEPNH